MAKEICAALRPAIAAALICIGLAAPARGSADIAAICDAVASEASRQSGVPLSVLRAITLTETGRRKDGAFRAWPWTVNMEGKGFWFDSQDDARAYVFKEFKRGARSFDVGCFQINYKWHGEAFASIDEMFDPLANALYAAKFLNELHAELGTWTRAAGAYHSRTPQYAERYAARFDEHHRRLVAAGDLPEPQMPYRSDIPVIPDIVLAANSVPEPPMPRVNRYPLLQAGAAGGMGSLVPSRPSGLGSLFVGAGGGAE